MKKPKKCRECERREMEQAREKILRRVLLLGRPEDVLQLKLNPCPNCGGRAELNVKYEGIGDIHCNECGYEIMFTKIESVFKEAVDAWNKGLYLQERRNAER